MDTTENDFGTVTEEEGGTITLRYQRVYSRSIQTVWSAITQPERLADWLGAVELDPCVGGRFIARVGPGGRVPITGTVLVWEPPVALACSWTWPQGSATVIRYDLTAEGRDATRLQFTHSGLPAEQVSAVQPGWHLYLERLGHVVGGEVPDPDFSERHAEIRELYGRRSGTQAVACQPPPEV